MPRSRALLLVLAVGAPLSCAATTATREPSVPDRSAFVETVSLIGDSATALVGWRTFEQPDYEVLREDGAFELRAYASFDVARTTDDGGESGAFGRLFRYLSGANAREAKVAMTAPVLMDRGGDATTMAFVLPRRYTTDTAPAPADAAIAMETEPAATYATIRFAGTLSEERVADRTAALRAWIASSGAEAVGEPLVAGYDPPYTLPPLRRNEVWIRVRDGQPVD